MSWGADDFVRVHFKSEKFATMDLAGFEFPVPKRELEGLAVGNTIGTEQLLFWLQCYSNVQKDEAGWKALEPAMMQLVEDIQPASTDQEGVLRGPNCTIFFAPVDLKREIVTVQRGDQLVAAFQNSDDGRLLTSVYRPLCSKSVDCIISLSVNPAEDGTVCMRGSNWEYALDCSASMGNVYADERGEAYLSYWEYGLGVLKDGTTVPEWASQQMSSPVASNHAATYVVICASQNE